MKLAVNDKDPAFSAMAMDILSNVLSRTDNPGNLGTYLTEEVRDLTDARCVLLIQCQSTPTLLTHRVVSVNPLRRRQWAESPSSNRLYEVVHRMPAGQLWRGEEPLEVAGLLRREGFELSMAIPLDAGGYRVGAMLVLGLPDEEHITAVLALLNNLSAVVALVLRNAIFFENQEQLIQERTAQLREKNEKLAMELAERERAEEAQREQNSTLRGIIDGVPALIFSVDRQYRYTSFNAAHAALMKALYGAEIEQGHSMLDYMTVAEDRETARHNLDRAAAGEQLAEEAYSGEELRSRQYFHVSHSPIRSDEGKVIGVAMLAQDMTERRRADEALHRLNRELRAISNCNQTLMRAEDEQTLLNDICRIICEDAAYRMAWVGYAEQDQAKTVRPMAVAGADDGYVASARISWGDDERGGGPAGVAIRTGATAYVQDLASDSRMAPWIEPALARGYRSTIALPIKDEGGAPFGALVIYATEPNAFNPEEIRLLEELAGDLAFGITVLRAKEAQDRLEEQLRQAQRMEAIGRLAGGIAHDFNNMLTAINGFADLVAARMAPDDPCRADVEEIRKAGGRAADLTHQLLAFSRRAVLKPVILDLDVVVAGLVPMLRRLIGEQIELRTFSGPGLGHILADPAQLEQVVLNLVLNARDAMPAGGELAIETSNVELDGEYVRTHPTATPGLYVRLEVSDTGVGMDAATLEQAFEPFFTTKPQGEGTGLGLATVYGIVTQSGGHVVAYSESGHGSAFRVYLPRVADDTTLPPRAVAGSDEGGSETILLVEDEDVVREFARRVLVRLGYTVLAAETPARALDLAGRAGPIDMLATDVIMPGMNGRELARQLVASRPSTRVLYLSGYSENHIVHQGILDPGVAFLGKPYTPGALAHAVREALESPASGPAEAASIFTPTYIGAYAGPTHGPRARRITAPIVYIAADMTNGGISAVADGVRESAGVIDWPLRIIDGQTGAKGRADAMRQAAALAPAGIILGGFDPAEQQAAISQAADAGIPVVGWHAGAKPGPDQATGLFTNITTDPVQVSTLAAQYAILDAGSQAGVVIYTDSQYQIAVDKANKLRDVIMRSPAASVLALEDVPFVEARQRMPSLVAAELREFGDRFTHMIGTNGSYFAGTRVALIEAGRSGMDTPRAVAAGDGDAAEFRRIREGDYQVASVAEPLHLQAWQLIDELNRAMAGELDSGYIAPPSLITRANVPRGDVFDPDSGYRARYRGIWGIR